MAIMGMGHTPIIMADITGKKYPIIMPVSFMKSMALKRRDMKFVPPFFVKRV